MDENKKNTEKPGVALRTLVSRWKDGTFREILDDWKWIFSYSKRYKGAIAFYVFLGIFSTTLGLIGAVASKYLIDIITGYKSEQLWLLILLTVGGTVFSLLINSLLGRVSLKLSIRINNDIQAEIFDKIMDGDWSELNKYESGDILNRFNNDIGTVSTNAISWLPTILVALYRFVATFLVILHYDWIMAVFAFGTAPILLLASRFVLGKQREYGKKVRKMSSQMVSFEVETFYNLDTIKSFGVMDHYGSRLRDWQEKFKKVNLDYNLFTIKTNVFLTLSGSLISLAAFGYCLYRLWTHAITYGTMTLFLQQKGPVQLLPVPGGAGAQLPQLLHLGPPDPRAGGAAQGDPHPGEPRPGGPGRERLPRGAPGRGLRLCGEQGRPAQLEPGGRAR